jgi:hypothetical protein
MREYFLRPFVVMLLCTVLGLKLAVVQEGKGSISGHATDTNHDAPHPLLHENARPTHLYVNQADSRSLDRMASYPAARNRMRPPFRRSRST